MLFLLPLLFSEIAAQSVGTDYSDPFVRNYIFPFAVAAIADTPEQCVKNNLPSAKIQSVITVNCSPLSNMTATCHGYLAVDSKNKLIVVAVRGTKGDDQKQLESDSMNQPKESFFGVGMVQPYFKYAYEQLWNGGIYENLTLLKKVFPEYNILVTGHSLGGSASCLIAARIIYEEIYPSERMKFVSFGQPRTGDASFSKWFNYNFIFAYRVVHLNDPVPHSPATTGGYFHHNFQVWYDNDMTIGSNYTVQSGDNGNNDDSSDDFNDHLWYFDKNVNTWASEDCK